MDEARIDGSVTEFGAWLRWWSRGEVARLVSGGMDREKAEAMLAAFGELAFRWLASADEFQPLLCVACSGRGHALGLKGHGGKPLRCPECLGYGYRAEDEEEAEDGEEDEEGGGEGPEGGDAGG